MHENDEISLKNANFGQKIAVATKIVIGTMFL